MNHTIIFGIRVIQQVTVPKLLFLFVYISLVKIQHLEHRHRLSVLAKVWFCIKRQNTNPCGATYKHCLSLCMIYRSMNTLNLLQDACKFAICANQTHAQAQTPRTTIQTLFIQCLQVCKRCPKVSPQTRSPWHFSLTLGFPHSMKTTLSARHGGDLVVVGFRKKWIKGKRRV